MVSRIQFLLQVRFAYYVTFSNALTLSYSSLDCSSLSYSSLNCLNFLAEFPLLPFSSKCVYQYYFDFLMVLHFLNTLSLGVFHLPLFWQLKYSCPLFWCLPLLTFLTKPSNAITDFPTLPAVGQIALSLYLQFTWLKWSIFGMEI